MDFILLNVILRDIILFIILFYLIKSINNIEKLFFLFMITIPFSIGIKIYNFDISISELIAIIIIIRSFFIFFFKNDLKFSKTMIIFVLINLISLFFIFLVNYPQFSERFFILIIKNIIYLLFALSIYTLFKYEKISSSLDKIFSYFFRGLNIVLFFSLISYIYTFFTKSGEIFYVIRDHSLFNPKFSTSFALDPSGLVIPRLHFFSEPKGLATLIVVGISYLLFSSQNKNKLLIFYVISLLMTFSRAGIILFLLILIIYFISILTNGEKYFNFKKFTTLFLILSLTLLTFFATLDLERNVLNTLSRENKEEFLRTVFEEYDYAIYKYYVNNPSTMLIPVGQLFMENNTRMFIDVPWGLDAPYNVRRGLIFLLVNYGIFSFVILFLIFLCTFEVKSYFFLAWFFIFMFNVEGAILLFHFFIIGYLFFYHEKLKNRSYHENRG